MPSRSFFTVIQIALAVTAWGPSPAWAAAEGSPPSLLGATVKMASALLLVIGLMLALVAYLRRFGVGRPQLANGAIIRILETRMLMPKKYISVVAVQGQLIVVGVTDTAVNVLTTMAADQATLSQGEGQARPSAGHRFAAILESAGKVVKGRQGQ